MAQTARVAYSPAEFAKLFGKSQTWGYRQIYGGKVLAITEHGRILIPAKEVERILESAGIYNGMEKPKAAAARAKKLSPDKQDIWRRFLHMRRQSNGKNTHGVPEMAEGSAKGQKGKVGQAIKSRLIKSWRRRAG